MAVLSDAEWLAAWHAAGCSPSAMARATGICERSIYTRRDRMRGRGHDLDSVSLNPAYQPARWTYPAEIPVDLCNASVLVGSDLHVWPGQAPLIWQAFCRVAEMVKPAAIVLNGDVIDGTRVSRHPRLRNQNAPRVTEEVDAARAWLDMLPPGGARLWTLGNHDTRVDNYLANQAPEMDDWAGGLADRFPEWAFAYAVTVNGTAEIRHTFRGGIHAAWNNTLHSGLSCITGHTHQLDVKAMVDRRGRRWGVETGMLNDPHAPQFEYGQGAPSRWTPGFALLSFDGDGQMLPPEICEMANGRAIFRGVPVLDTKPRVRVPAGKAA